MSQRFAINEIFETLQGEAHWTGAPSIFLRLQGCPVGCPWCDTKHTWDVDPSAVISVHDMLAKSGDAPTYALMSIEDILDALAGLTARHVVITGGEPCLYDLRALTKALIARGKSVQIETSGTQPVLADDRVWVTVSPKIDMPGGYKVLDEAVSRANELKFPVGKLEDVETFAGFLEGRTTRGDIWLQPLSRSPKATDICIREATKHGWRVSIQMHQFLGLR